MVNVRAPHQRASLRPLTRLVAALLAGVAAVCLSGALGQTADARKTRPHLTAFRSCAGLVSYARRFAKRTGGEVTFGGVPRPVAVTTPAPESAPAAPGAPQPTAGQQAPTDDTSGTNVQEAGVDEPDLVKTDGRTIFALAQGSLQAVDARAATPRLLGSLALSNGTGYGYGSVLLLRRGRALVISQPAPVPVPLPGPVATAPPAQAAQTAIAPIPYRPTTLLTEIDVRDPAAMKITRTLEVDGTYVDGREHGGTARLVISSYPRGLEAPVSSPRRARPTAWLPAAVLTKARANARTRHRAVSCRAVRHARTFQGVGTLTVLTIDLDRGLPAVDSDAVMTDAQTVYASAGSLYVASQRWIDPDTRPDRLPNTVTEIHRFAISNPVRTTYEGSGSVPGFLLNQFSMSEEKNVLRVASTQEPTTVGPELVSPSESLVTTLAQRGPRLTTLGQVGGLGRGERVRAVRFLGDQGFIVTFRQTDPLYTLDLSDPAQPRVRGELAILGYSAYLHPVGRDLLLGVGQDASAQGQTRGAQLSLFDVSDLTRPTRLARHSLGAFSSTEVEFDHHAFLYWPATALAVVPVQAFDQRNGNQLGEAIAVHVSRSAGLDEVGRVAHDSGRSPIRRSVVVGARLFTLSDAGALASDLRTLAAGTFVSFPAAATTTGP